MPKVQSSNFILLLPQLVNINRGVDKIITVSLHDGFIGNTVDIVNLNEVVINVINSNNIIVKTFKKSDSTLSFGVGNEKGLIYLNLTSVETKNLPQGSVHIEMSITTGVKLFNLPRLRIGSTVDGGVVLPDGTVPGRFSIPAPIYKIKSFNLNTNQPQEGDLPAAGETVFETSNPKGLTNIIINNTDDLGKRNSYIETILTERFTGDGLNVNLFITNIFDVSSYAIYKVVSWNRVEILDGGVESDAEMVDGIQLELEPEGASKTNEGARQFQIGDTLGFFLDSYGDNSVTVSDANDDFPGTKNIKFIGGITLTDNGDGDITVKIPYFDDVNGIINGVDGTSGVDGQDGTSGVDGQDGTSGQDGQDGTSGQDGQDGTSGVDGQDGTSGVDGTSGTSGQDGTSGTSGSSGTSGTSGVDGQSGTSGVDGQSGTSGVDGIGIPQGGTTGQFLVKLSDNDYETTWTNLTPDLDEEGREITDDLNQIPNNTTGDAAATGVFISFTPFADSNVQVLVNGISINLADGELEKASQPCYFSDDDGLTARNIADIEADDQLFWNGSIAKYNLDDTDDVDLLYEASNRDL